MDVDGGTVVAPTTNMIHKPTMMIEFSDGLVYLGLAHACKNIELVGVTRNTNTFVAHNAGAICECCHDVNVIGIVSELGVGYVVCE